MRESVVERSILVDLLVHGDDKASNIGRRVERPPSSVSRSLKDLTKDSLLVDKGGGVYKLTESGEKQAQSLIKAGFNPYELD